MEDFIYLVVLTFFWLDFIAAPFWFSPPGILTTKSTANRSFSRPPGDARIEIISSGYVYEFQLRPPRNRPTLKTLHYTVRPVSESTPKPNTTEHFCGVDYRTDAVVRLHNVPFDIQRYLFLQRFYEKLSPPLYMERRAGHTVRPENQYEILTAEAMQGCLYVKGMQISDGLTNTNRSWRDGGKAFGYNLLNFVLKCRDRRNSISFQDEKKEVEAAWAEVLLKCDHTSTAERREQGKAERAASVKSLFNAIWNWPSCFECVVIKQSGTKESDEIRTLLKDHFYNEFRGAAEPYPTWSG